METDAYLKYPTIEEYVTKELNLDLENEVKKWYENYIAHLITYNESKWGYYPKVIRNYLKCARATSSV